MDKKKRIANFSNDEKVIVTNLILKHNHVIENKRTDAATNLQNTQEWITLADEFNNISSHCYRTPNSLKTCWENIKRQKKKESASRKREIFMTGGGKPPPSPSHREDRIVEAILGPALEGIENRYDSDAVVINDKENKQTPMCIIINDETEVCENSDDIQDNTRSAVLKHSFHSKIHDDLDEILSIPQPSTQEKELTTALKSSNNNRLALYDDNNELVSIPGSCTNSQEKVFLYPAIFCRIEHNTDFTWQHWTPSSLKQPVTSALKLKGPENKNNWLKRRRPQNESLSVQLLKEKIKLVKTLIENANEEE